VRLSKPLIFAIRFAKFSVDYGIPAPDLAQMIAAANASKAAYERDDSASESRHGARVEEIATRYGCRVDWPGLWPCIEKAGLGNTPLPSL
jgi:hypothetical protein